MTYESEIEKIELDYKKCVDFAIRQPHSQKSILRFCQKDLAELSNAVAEFHGKPKPYKKSWWFW